MQQTSGDKSTCDYYGRKEDFVRLTPLIKRPELIANM
jgi:hypothetical protein